MKLTSALIILVADHSADAERLRGVLTAARYRVLTVADGTTAEARIAGGGVDLVVLALPASVQAERVRETAASIHRRNPELPVVVLADANHAAIPAGDSIPPDLPVIPEADLASTAHTLIERRRTPPRKPARESPGGIVSVQGAKGGVGVSTVALNPAVLARQGKTILIEMRAGPGTLAFQFRVRRQVRTIADLAATDGAIVPADIEGCLWPCHQVLGLNILFAPLSFETKADWAARVSQILGAAAEVADSVVIDLPQGYCALHRAVLRETDCLLLVLERDAVCLDAGKLLLGAIESENLLPPSAAAVVVNRVPLAIPLGLTEVENALTLPVLVSIPPDADLCLRAYRARTAVVPLDPESLLARTYSQLAESLPATLRSRQATPA